MREDTAVRTVVTVQEGKVKRRYLVVAEETYLFDTVGSQPYWNRAGLASWSGFGAQWLRGRNVVDEMYRTLPFGEVLKVDRREITVRWPY